MKGSMGANGMIPQMVPLGVTTEVESEPTPCWVPTQAMHLDMVMIFDERVLGLNEESNELGEESAWGLMGI